jgi:hypothetical protein
MNNQYVVYQHRRKDNNEVFYVGQGTLKRAYESVKNRRNTNWLEVVKNCGGFEVDILAQNLTKEQSLLIEQEYIKKYGTIKHSTGNLVNERLSGSRGVESGYKHTKEKRKQISEKTKEAMKNPKVLEKLSNSLVEYWKIPDSKIKASKATKGIQSGEKHPLYGKKHSEETIKKMKESHKNRVHSPQRKIQCPHCLLTGGASGMVKYHFNNCKNKK